VDIVLKNKLLDFDNVSVFTDLVQQLKVCTLHIKIFLVDQWQLQHQVDTQISLKTKKNCFHKVMKKSQVLTLKDQRILPF